MPRGCNRYSLEKAMLMDYCLEKLMPRAMYLQKSTTMETEKHSEKLMLKMKNLEILIVMQMKKVTHLLTVKSMHWVNQKLKVKMKLKNSVTLKQMEIAIDLKRMKDLSTH